MVEVVTPIIYGLFLGGVLALVSVGFSLSWGVLNVIDLTHGIQIILGAYISFWLYAMYGLNFWLTIPFGFLTLFVLAYAYQRFVLQRFIGREDYLYVIVASFGMLVLIEALMDHFWKVDYRSVNLNYPTFELLGTPIPSLRVIAFVTSLLMTILLAYFLRRTKRGFAIRAIRDNEKAARLHGVDTKHTYALTMGIKGGLAAIGGALILTLTPINPLSHMQYLQYAFIVVVIGGLGSVVGSLAGGMILGILISTISWFATQDAANAVAFMILVVFLFVRPTGLLGIEEES